MAHPALEALTKDVHRWVWSGALAARGDARLAEHRATLAALGAQVPALAKLGDAVGKLQAAAPEELGGSLLPLNTAVGQLSAAQAEASAPAGELSPFREPRRRDFAPAPVRVFYALIEALESKKKPPDSLIDALASSALAGDARLWPWLVKGFAHPYLREAVVPIVAQIGEAIVPALEEGFSPKGKDPDAARLRALGGILGAQGEPRYRACLEKGSRPVRLAALECFHFLGPEAFEKLLLSELAAAKADERVDFLPALARAGSDRTLQEAIQIIKASPSSITRLLDALSGENARRFVAQVLDTDLPVPEPTFDWLVERRVVGTSDLLLRMLTRSHERTRKLAATKLLQLGDPAGLQALVNVAEKDASLHAQQVDALLKLGPAVAYERLAPLFERFVPAEPSGSSGGGFFAKAARFLRGPEAAPHVVSLDFRALMMLQKMSPEADPRWVALLVKVLPLSPGAVAPGLGKLGSLEAVPALMEAARSGKRETMLAAFQGLAALHVREAVPLVCEWAKHNLEDAAIGHAIAALREIGDPAALGPLREIAASPAASSFVRQFVGHAIGTLEAKQA